MVGVHGRWSQARAATTRALMSLRAFFGHLQLRRLLDIESDHFVRVCFFLLMRVETLSVWIGLLNRARHPEARRDRLERRVLPEEDEEEARRLKEFGDKV